MDTVSFQECFEEQTALDEELYALEEIMGA